MNNERKSTPHDLAMMLLLVILQTFNNVTCLEVLAGHTTKDKWAGGSTAHEASYFTTHPGSNTILDDVTYLGLLCLSQDASFLNGTSDWLCSC